MATAAVVLTVLVLLTFLAPAVLSVLRGKTADGACDWVEHSGGLQVVELNEGVDSLAEAKTHCEANPACLGVTLSVEKAARAYYMRDGQYAFDLRNAFSPSDLASWIKVCPIRREDLYSSGGSDRAGAGAGSARAAAAAAARASSNGNNGLNGAQGLRGGEANFASGYSGSGVFVAAEPKTQQDQSEGNYPFPRDITIPPKKGNGIIYVLYWKETKSGCTWQGLDKVCATEDNHVKGFEAIPEATTAQTCEVGFFPSRVGIYFHRGRE